jgi:two-component system KDP operon response regulator KdpE
VQINYATHEVSVHGKPVKLTPIEYKLLYQLTRNTGQVLLHDQLLTRVWGPEYRGELDYLRIYVRRLREKLEDTPQTPTRILTERGTGYRYVQEEDTP